MNSVVVAVGSGRVIMQEIAQTWHSFGDGSETGFHGRLVWGVKHTTSSLNNVWRENTKLNQPARVKCLTFLHGVKFVFIYFTEAEFNCHI